MLNVRLKEHLHEEFPKASSERLDALAHRLLFEKLLADAKISKFAFQHITLILVVQFRQSASNFNVKYKISLSNVVISACLRK